MCGGGGQWATLPLCGLVSVWGGRCASVCVGGGRGYGGRAACVWGGEAWPHSTCDGHIAHGSSPPHPTPSAPPTIELLCGHSENPHVLISQHTALAG